MKSNHMHRFLFLLFLLNTVTVFGQDSLVAKTFLNNRVHLLVPKSFTEKSQKAIAEKFPNPNSRPAVMLSDKEEFTSLKIIPMPLDVNDNEVGEYKAFHVSNMKKEPNQQWLGDAVKTVNGKKVGIIKVIHTDRNVFAYYFFTSMDGKLLLLTYNCVDKLWPALEEKVEAIVQSLKID